MGRRDRWTEAAMDFISGLRSFLTVARALIVKRSTKNGRVDSSRRT